MKNKKKSILSPALLMALVFSFMFAFGQNVNNQTMEKKSERHVAWSRHANIYEVNIRQYTPEGTFKAFQQHLPRLQKMGVKILWLMPIYPIGEKNRKGTLGSYYAVQNYEAVNPNFGTLDDLKSLVKDAHARGMHVILDWVANHTAWDNVWVKEHPDWYKKDSSGNFVSPFDWTDVIALNYDNQDLRHAMINAMIFWLKNADVDGFRCDVAGMVPVDFWDEARTALDKVKPVFMLAEDEDNVALVKYAFDMNYTWKMLHLMNDIASGKKKAAEIWNYLKWNNETFDPDVYRMYFTSNHDENSWNGTAFERLGDAFKVFTVFDYTIPGMPLIYGGEEAGNNKRLRFFEKDTINWSQLPYAEFYGRLNHLKDTCSLLTNGDEGGKLIPLSEGISDDVFAFYREKGGRQMVVILNLCNQPRSFTLNNEKIKGKYKLFFKGEEIEIQTDWVFHLPAWGYTVLLK
ncbi:alpha-amylase [Candidatus Sulfidibacterium hydrothermale]|uniref:alpha-amylase family glycosyl hydrolase n=1 Tax=Candidatus Sulfidibacterium hydrothermale TaxID=2875962 RepID=UPI001F0A9DA7|nr:alpha-amylase family glycosyl hydrolase [Candidatus Sulfidibacterium hydrothermale]UBM62816.1 alpha-amylase [Candidatus Sulfidibacterium hydrothermale]